MKDEAKKLYDYFKSFLLEHDENLIKSKNEMIPTGIDILDLILGGGFVIGSLSILSGDIKSCNLLVMSCLKLAQKKFKNIIECYLDSGYFLTSEKLCIFGIKNPKIRPYSGVTFIKLLYFIDKLCKFKELNKVINIPSIIVWDSTLDNTLEHDSQRDLICSRVYPIYTQKCSKYNICIIVINQLNTDYSKNNVLKNTKIFHILDFEISHKRCIFDKNLISTVKCKENKIFPNDFSITLIGNKQKGFSNFWTNFNFLVERNLIDEHILQKIKIKELEKVYQTNHSFRNHFDKMLKNELKIFKKEVHDM